MTHHMKNNAFAVWILSIFFFISFLTACSQASGAESRAAASETEVITANVETAAATETLAASVTTVASATPAPSERPAASATTVPTPTASATESDSSDSIIEADSLVAFEEVFETLYDAVDPSVVHLQVVKKDQSPAPELLFPNLPNLPPADGFQRGSGSGFVWDKAGHIVTNNHVIEGAERIRVTFADGTMVEGEVIGTDRDSDLAVVEVEVPEEKLHPVTLTDSTEVDVGQLAVAIGNPFNQTNTMTVGFVSALGRLLPLENRSPENQFSIPDMIQTDAAINPGNSGGVLVDSRGRLIGVTTAIISPVGASVGLGFAIPSIIVQKVVPALIEDGFYEHPWLGISGMTLQPEIAEAMEFDAFQQGALVMEIVPDSPADDAGLRGSDRTVTIDEQDVRLGGDLIIAADGQPIKEMDDLVIHLARHGGVEQPITLTVLRDGKEETVEVTLAARPSSRTEQNAQNAWLGIVGRTLTPEIAQEIGVEDEQGVLVEQVEHNSPADEAGLRGSYKPLIIDGQSILVGGDIIVAVGEQPVTEMETLQALLQQAEPGEEITVTVLRDGKRMELSVTLGVRER